jgi:2,4-dienoyl-CoA reductase-like NADH-dependent reductase (Old Yellow Enzyme family)
MTPFAGLAACRPPPTHSPPTHTYDAGFGFHGKDRAVTLFDVKSRFGGTVMGNVGFTRDTADGAIRTGAADLVGAWACPTARLHNPSHHHAHTFIDTTEQVAFGRPYISNPDLAERFAADVPLTPSPPPERWYRGGEHDYVDWPAHEEDKSRL